jgi:hypothetical protein
MITIDTPTRFRDAFEVTTATRSFVTPGDHDIDDPAESEGFVTPSRSRPRARRHNGLA